MGCHLLSVIYWPFLQCNFLLRGPGSSISKEELPREHLGSTATKTCSRAERCSILDLFKFYIIVTNLEASERNFFLSSPCSCWGENKFKVLVAGMLKKKWTKIAFLFLIAFHILEPFQAQSDPKSLVQWETLSFQGTSPSFLCFVESNRKSIAAS